MNRFSYFALALAALGCTPPPPTGAPPAAPFGLQIPSGSLGSTRAIKVRGSAESGVTVELFLDRACGGPAVSGSLDEFQGAGLAVTVAANQVTELTARAVRDGVNSSCSQPISFTHDDIAPAAPLTTSVTTTQPGTMPRVGIEGTTEAGASVFVFLNGSCEAGNERAALVQGTFFSLELGVPANTETLFTALAIDAAGNRSACSSPPLRYAHDSQPPAPPVLTALVPTGPSSNAQPMLSGTAEPGSRLRFFAGAGCGAVALMGTATADTTGAFSALVTVPLNATTALKAIASDASDNASGCSNTLSYQHDDVAPAPVVFAATTPLSPSRTAMTFQVPVTAEAGSTVQLFTVAGCTGTPAFTQPAPATFTVAVAANTRQVLSARALDAAGNSSPCASSQLEHDDVPPAVATWTGSMPTSPSNLTSTFSLSGTGEGGATATFYRSIDCTTLASTMVVPQTGAFIFARTISSNSTQYVTATLTDPAGNVSGCSAPFELTHDNIAPVRPIFWGTLPPSPSSSTGSVKFAGVAETNSTVRLYTSSACAGIPNTTTTVSDLINGSASQGHFSATTTPVLGGTLQLYALAVDAAGNASPCSTTSASYEQRATSAWGNEVTLSTVPASSGTFVFPSAVLLPNGDAVAVGMRSQLVTGGVVTSSFSSGAWSTATEFATTGSFINPVNLVSDASGTVLAAWTHSPTTWAARRSAAGVWGAPENLGTTNYGWSPAVALDGSGNGVFVTERFVTSSVRIIARRSTGATWGAETYVNDANYNSFSPRVAMAPSGRVVVVYARNRGSGTSPIDELFSVTGEVATGWGVPAQRSGAMITREDISLELTATGDALTTWLERPTYLAPMTPMVSQSTGTTWTAASALTATTTSRAGMVSRAFANGEAIAAWVTTQSALMIARRSTAGVWGAGAALAGATGVFEPRLAAEPGGRAALVWSTTDGNATAKYFWFSTLAAGVWSAPQLLDVNGLREDGAAIAIDAQGRMVAVWTRTNATDSRLMARRLE